jgi:hypothetical protein
MRALLHKLLTVVFALLLFVPLNVSPMTEVAFAAQALDSGFPNPERGFYDQDAPFWFDTQRTPQNVDTLRALRQRGISMLRWYFLVDEYRSVPFPNDALTFMRAQLQAVRDAGLKVIPRFAYNFPTSGTYPYQEPDAPVDRVLAHIAQLEPILREYADVIAFMEIGFVGAWGEWHSSTNNLVNFPSGINASSRVIVERLLQALPPERMIAMRYPPYKQQFYGTTPLTPAQAHSGTPQARMGAHNDCFLASNTDWGTYPENEAAREALKNYLSLDNRYLPQGGETCNFGEDAQPYVGCTNVLSELVRLRYSTLNIDYEENVLNGWRTGGCFDEIADRLGYRFRLTGAVLSETAAPGGAFDIAFSLVNDGFAAPYNPRGLEIILRSGSGALYRLPLQTQYDPRFWLPDSGEITVSAQAGLPADMPPGQYEILLNLPDPQPTLYSRPEYAIRLANTGVWEAATGFNRLNAYVTIDAAPASTAYTGDWMFVGD